MAVRNEYVISTVRSPADAGDLEAYRLRQRTDR